VDIQWARQIDRLLCNGQEDQAVAQVDEATSATPNDAYVVMARCMIFFYAADWPNALAQAAASLEAAKGANDKLAEAYASSFLSAVLAMMGRNEDSLQSATAAVEAAHNAGDKSAEGEARSAEAAALSRVGRQEQALQSATTAVETARVASDLVAEAKALLIQASVLGTLGRTEELLQVAVSALAVAPATDNRVIEASILHAHTAALILLGRNEEALQATTAAAQVGRAAKNRVLEVNMLGAKAGVLLALNRNEESLEAANAAVEVARTIDTDVIFARAANTQALAFLNLDRYPEALGAATTASKAAAAAGNKATEGNALFAQAVALHMLDRHKESLEAATAAVKAARAANSIVGEINSLNIQAPVLRLLDRHEESLEAATAAAELAGTAGLVAAEATAIANQVAVFCEMGKAEGRQKALEELVALDPGAASRLATLPLRRGWYRMCRRILAAKTDREKDLREVLDLTPIAAELPDGFLGEFRVLRNWASYTTIDLMRPLAREGSDSSKHAGGGYFLWWQGWGLVIDPGLGFGKAYRDAGFLPRNISAVAATHHHIDHTGEMLPILTCVFEMNHEKNASLDTGSQVDFLLAPGVFSAFASVAAYVPGVRSVRLLRPKESSELALPGSAMATVTAIEAKHRDLTGRDDAAIGLRIDVATIDGKRCSVGLSGDTRLIEETAEAFKDVDLMIVHIGSIYEHDIGTPSSGVRSVINETLNLLATMSRPNEVLRPEPSPWHLGFSGTVELLQEIKKRSKEGWDPLVLVSEWGEELAPDRSEICEAVAQSAGIKRVFPAAWNQGVALAAAGPAQPICARRHGKIADHWHDNHGRIEYLCSEHDHPPANP
jgi:tetratricopeptide (TPR) repeat protein